MKRGTKHTAEARKKNRVAHLGKRTGKQNNKWRGDKVSYRGLHDWVRDNYGKPTKCESNECLRESTAYQWSNVSGEYKRDRKDWQQLCVPCHRKYDYKSSPFCRNGHELKTMGVWIDSRGSRICKECKRKAAHVHYEKHKQQIIERVNKWRKLRRSTIKH